MSNIKFKHLPTWRYILAFTNRKHPDTVYLENQDTAYERANYILAHPDEFDENVIENATRTKYDILNHIDETMSHEAMHGALFKVDEPDASIALDNKNLFGISGTGRHKVIGMDEEKLDDAIRKAEERMQY